MYNQYTNRELIQAAQATTNKLVRVLAERLKEREHSMDQIANAVKVIQNNIEFK